MQVIKKLMLMSVLFCHSTSLFSAHEVNEELQRELNHFVCCGNVDEARSVLERGADVNKRGPVGLTPLGIASIQLNLPMAKLLLDRNADVNGADASGDAPLHLAAVANIEAPNAPVVELLLAHNADVNMPGLGGNTPLTRSYSRIKVNPGSEKTRELLIAAGAHE